MSWQHIEIASTRIWHLQLIHSHILAIEETLRFLELDDSDRHTFFFHLWLTYVKLTYQLGCAQFDRKFTECDPIAVDLGFQTPCSDYHFSSGFLCDSRGNTYTIIYVLATHRNRLHTHMTPATYPFSHFSDWGNFAISRARRLRSSYFLLPSLAYLCKTHISAWVRPIRPKIHWMRPDRSRPRISDAMLRLPFFQRISLRQPRQHCGWWPRIIFQSPPHASDTYNFSNGHFTTPTLVGRKVVVFARYIASPSSPAVIVCSEDYVQLYVSIVGL